MRSMVEGACEVSAPSGSRRSPPPRKRGRISATSGRPCRRHISPKDQLGAAANLLYQTRCRSKASRGKLGGGAVNGFFRTLARAAVSKAAAFSYAVAVGVAGNVVFHYVQTHDAVPNIAPPSVAPPHQEAAAPVVKSPAVAT